MDQNIVNVISRLIIRLTRDYVSPIYWASNTRVASAIERNGSCFFLHIGDVVFGVTANHVYAEYERSKRTNPSLSLFIGRAMIQSFTVIDRDESVDILTFNMSPVEFAAIGKSAYKVKPEEWPPLPPQVGDRVVLTGYAEMDRTVLQRENVVDFLQIGSDLIVESIHHDQFEIQLREGGLISLGNGHFLSVRRNFSGNSGAAVWAIAEGVGRLVRPVGIVLRQTVPHGEDDFVSIFVRRHEYIKPDGTLNRDENYRCVPKYRETCLR